MKKHTFSHDYPMAPGVSKDRSGSGTSPHKHPYPAGGMGVMRSDMQGSAGPSAWPHDYPHASQPSGHATNLKGTKKPPLTHHLKKRSRGGAHAMGSRN